MVPKGTLNMAGVGRVAWLFVGVVAMLAFAGCSSLAAVLARAKTSVFILREPARDPENTPRQEIWRAPIGTEWISPTPGYTGRV